MTARRYIGQKRGDLKLVLLCGVLGALALALLLGCNSAPGAIAAQKPGVATGAGATFTGPTNAAQPSSQKARRTIAYAKPETHGLRPDAPPAPTVPAAMVPEVHVDAPQIPAPQLPPLAYVQEETETTFGAHQDAASIVKAAAVALGPVRTAGLALVLLGIGGMLHSAGNQQSGYPACWLLTAASGALLILTNSWLLLIALAVPAVLYLAQKFGLLRIPPIP